MLVFAILLLFSLAGCGKERAQGGTVSDTVRSSSDRQLPVVAEGGETGAGIENYTRYADYEPVGAEPAGLIAVESRNVLIAYFSRAGNTAIPEGVDAMTSASLNIGKDGAAAGNAEQIAKWIAEETGGDLFLIQTEYTYPLDYEKTVDVGEGQDTDGYHPALASHVEDMGQYDTVYLVYPIWHYTLSVPMCSFLDEYDLGGKTVYAFAVHAGSRFADSISRIQDAEPGASVLEGVSVSEREMPGAKEMVLEYIRSHVKAADNGALDSALDAESSVPGAVGEMEGTTDMKINVQIGNTSFAATLEDTAAAREFAEMMRSAPISISMSDYSGFEKVGSLGRSLTSDNRQTTASAGDIVLYSGNQIVMFYGSNSWNYTRIGKIDDLSGWEEALGSGDVTAVFTLME